MGALGSKATRVGWDRLCTPGRDGGWNVLNPEMMGRRLHRGWLSYLRQAGRGSTFIKVVSSWTERLKGKVSWSSLGMGGPRERKR